MSGRMATPVPRLMRTLERDRRGYPIPYIVLRDTSGKPQFTINDHQSVAECLRKHLCAICGKRMPYGERWFIGGSRCFTHEHGAFLDPPLHIECAEYALIVCPFLALRSYSGRIDDKLLDPANTPAGMIMVKNDHMPPDRPAFTGLGMCRDYATMGDPWSVMFRVRNWRYVEWWKDGVRINAPSWSDLPR